MSINKKLHWCEIKEPFKEANYGTAIYVCYETEDGELWVGNDEYCNTVNYCPFCGFKSKLYDKKRTSNN